MASIASFSVADRRREKQLAREQDEVRLQHGEVEARALRDRNGFFSLLDASKARIVSRRVRVRV